MAIFPSKLNEVMSKWGKPNLLILYTRNVAIITDILYFRQWWMPDTGGANIPALNDLIMSLGMAFG
jgi:hypothetical protein